MLRTAHLPGTTRVLAVALAMMAGSPSAGPVMVRSRGFEDFMPNFDAEQSARLKPKRRGH